MRSAISRASAGFSSRMGVLVPSNPPLRSFHGRSTIDAGPIGDAGAQLVARTNFSPNTRLSPTSTVSFNRSYYHNDHRVKDYYRPYSGKVEFHAKNGTIGDEGASHIAAALRSDKKVESLRLSGNQIGDEGAAHIADAMRDNKTLLHLDLADNKLSSKGAQALMEGLSHNTTLEGLDLCGNKFADYDFLQSLSYNTVLQMSSRDFSFLGAREAAYLEGVKERNGNIYRMLESYSSVLKVLLFRAATSKSSPDAPFVLPEDISIELNHLLVIKAKESLFAKFSNSDFLDLYQYWQKPLSQSALAKINNCGKVEWPSLFGAISEIKIPPEISGAEGWKLVVRKSSEELINEGKRLKHCVGDGGYTKACIYGTSHIVSIEDGDGNPVSTIEIILDYQRHELLATRHAAANNNRPSEQCSKIEEWFSNQIKTSSIAINYKSLLSEANKRKLSPKTFREVAIKFIGFDPFDDERFRDFRDAMKDTVMPKDKKRLMGEFLQTRSIDLEHMVINRESEFVLNASRNDIDSIKKAMTQKYQKSLNKIFGENVVKVSIVSLDPDSRVTTALIAPQNKDAVAILPILEAIESFGGKLKKEIVRGAETGGVIVSGLRLSDIDFALTQAVKKMKPRSVVGVAQNASQKLGVDEKGNEPSLSQY